MNNTKNFMEWVQANEFRKHLLTLILVFIGLLLIVKTVLVYKEAVNYKNINNTNYISVNGKAERYIKPDTLTFNITVNEEGTTNAEATQKVAAKISKAKEILKAHGVKEENIKTGSYNVQDKYENVAGACSYGSEIMPSGKVMSIPSCQVTNSKIVGQIVTEVDTIKIPDIDKNADNDTRAKIMAELAAQNIKADGFAFTIFDVEAVRKDIRAEAIATAKTDAKKLAKDLGIRLDRISSFSDNSGPYNPYISARSEGAMKATDMIAPSAPTLSPGQEKITVEVTLTYSIK